MAMNRWALSRPHTMSATTVRALRAICIGAALLAAATAMPPAHGASTPVVVVQIRDYNFRPSGVTVQAGDTVAFENIGGAIHRIVADDGSFDSRDLSPGTGFNAVIDTPGELRVHCEIHPSMTGVIIVGNRTITPSSAPATSTPATSTPSASTPATGRPATATTAPLPTKLADTGVGDTSIVAVAFGCLFLGFCAISLHQRRLRTLATEPSEAAWRSVTVGQRHHDDLIARRRG